jgi:thiol-disulfide isomerase/thioredoxin
LGRNLEAFRYLEALVSKGQGGSEAIEQLKGLYIKLNGSDSGYDKYLLSLKEKLEKETNEALTKNMINEPAPDFSLKDLDGNTVSLAECKGKIVVLDFWATWCTPCKKSFPAMQMAVNKYKNDPDIIFLFIHTWEKEDDATKSAIAYLKENNYSFKLLMDLKDPNTKTNKVVESFKVSGIPTKFIIDGKGNIRFKVTGFSGGNEEAVAEISKMIEMAKGR